MNFFLMVQMQFNTKTHIIISDNGERYFNERLGNFFLEKGVIHQSSCADTPQQNGVTKCKNKHLLEVTRALMFARNVPKHLWGDAVLTTTYLINQMSSEVLNFQTPIRTLKECYRHLSIFNSLPLKVFGSSVFVHVPDKDRSKLEPLSAFSLIFSNPKGV